MTLYQVLMTEAQEIAIDIAIRDLMGATVTLMEMPIEFVRAEYDDIDAVHKRLTMLLMRMRKREAA